MMLTCTMHIQRGVIIKSHSNEFYQRQDSTQQQQQQHWQIIACKHS